MKSDLYVLLSIILVCSCSTLPHPGFTMTLSANHSLGYLSGADSENKVNTPPTKHYDFSEYYFHNLKKTFTLEDGREVTCNIPLYESESDDEVMTTRNITDEEAEVLLSNLKDNCARMRTPEFLWELCHNNYARQYDDRMTMLNAGKPAAELFFLGFPSLAKKSEFNRVITASTGDYNPQSSNPDMFSTFEIPEYKYAYISGYQMKLINAKKGVMSYNDYFITFWVPKKIVTNDTIIENRMKYKQFLETKTVEKITKKKNNEEYIKIFRKAHDVVINNIIILNEPFPVDVVVDDITFDELPKKIVTEEEAFYGNIYKNYVYGAAFSFLTMVQEGNTIILVMNKTEMFERTVMRIHSDFVLELDKEVSELEKMNYVLTDIFIVVAGGPDAKDIAWQMKKGNVTIFGNTVIGDNTTNFIKEFERGDMFRVVVSHRPFKVFIAEVLEVVNDWTLIVRGPRPDHNYKKKLKEYLVGKYRNWEEYKQKNTKKRNLYVAPSLENINYQAPPHIVVLYNFEDYSMNVVGEHMNFKDPEYWLFQFKYYELHHDSSLMFLFTEKLGEDNGITVHFYDNKKIIIKKTGEYSNFKSVTLPISISGVEGTLDKSEIWITYANGILRVGLTNIVSAQSQLISFEVGQKLGFYQILTKFTYNLYVAEIFIMTPPKLLNATIETMELKHTNQHEDIRYFQYWNYGTQCGMNARTVTLEYKCSATRAFFEIEKLTEPSMCNYHMLVGTIYMCPKKEDRGAKDILDFSSKLNCIV